mgnify:CR=1 FL=1
MVTLESLKRDILRLQELAVSQGKRISELEEDIRPTPQEPDYPKSKRMVPP